jgi:hypothetical protein
MQLQSGTAFKLRSRAIGLIEVLGVLAVITFLFIIVMPLPPRGGKARAQRITCINNLRQLGIASRTWSSEHGDAFPWNVTMRSNGVMEIATSGNVAALFCSMSNHIVSGKTLSCPADAKRKREADLFKIEGKDISYFIGLDADPHEAQTILSGDRNLAGGILMSGRVMLVSATNVLVWGKDIHSHAGNVGLGDGSAQQLSDTGLQKQITAHLQSFTSAPSSQAV